MCNAVGVVEPDRTLIVGDRVIECTVLEQEIADIHQRGRARGVQCERCGEILQCRFALTLMDTRDAAFIDDRGPLRVRCGCSQEYGKLAFRLRVRAGRKQPQGAIVGRGGGGGPEKCREFAQVEHFFSMLTIDVLTLFPEVFAPFIGLSIVGRAVEAGLVTVNYHHILDALRGRERADDTPYGGGAGMVIRIEPMAKILDSILACAPHGERRIIVMTTPAGRPFAQADATEFSGLDRLVIVCGHYEGIDERLTALYPVQELSLGDFVLTGGEIPALAIMDATVRLVEGAVRAASLHAESFTDGVLDYPAYTRPPRFRGVDVPEVLLSGDHAKIAAWRREASRERTRSRRPDLE